MIIESDDHYIQLAIDCAEHHQTPYGALILNKKTGNYLVRANTTSSGDKTAHAEMNALRNLQELNFSDKVDLILYSTAEPCPMCMGASIWCGIKEVKFGISIKTIQEFHHQIEISSLEIAKKSWIDCNITSGISEQACYHLFKKYA